MFTEETGLHGIQPRTEPWGWALCCSLFTHAGAILTLSLYVSTPLPSKSPPRAIKVELISMLATPNAKNIAIPIPKIQDPALVAPVQKPRPVIPKALKPIPKPDVTLNPEPEIVHQQTEAPIIERERSVSAETATSEDIPLATLTEAEIGTAQTPVISAQDYRLKNYSLLIRERINKVKRYPMMARKAGKQGSVVVEFNLNRRGELLGSQVVNSCGTKALDNAALKALTRASPFDQLPDNLKSPHTFKVRINFFLAG